MPFKAQEQISKGKTQFNLLSRSYDAPQSSATVPTKHNLVEKKNEGALKRRRRCRGKKRGQKSKNLISKSFLFIWIAAKNRDKRENGVTLEQDKEWGWVKAGGGRGVSPDSWLWHPYLPNRTPLYVEQERAKKIWARTELKARIKHYRPARAFHPTKRLSLSTWQNGLQVLGVPKLFSLS